EFFYQVQMMYLITIAIEVIIDRTFYRVGTAFTPGRIYDSIMIIGNFSRILMVLLNFSILGLYLYKTRISDIFTLIVIFEAFFFFTSYLFYYLNLEFPIFFQFTGFLIGGFIINFLLIQKIRLNEFESESRRASIVGRLILLSIIVIFDFALIHELLFTLNARYNIPLIEQSKILFNFAQILTVIILSPLVFILPLTSRKYIKLKGIVKKIPIVVIIAGVIVILGFVNSGLVMATEEHPTLITAPAIFAWSIIFILNFTYIALSMFLLNLSILSFGIFLIGVYLLWVIGKTQKKQYLKQFSYGLFFLFSSAFMFVEQGTDLFFFIETFNSILILTIFLKSNKKSFMSS
ncbi:MAG: hypothetical protein ACW99L_15655, partial [Promethearchaeota archaeon]